MQVTHGCMRLYPEDIEALYNMVPVNTPVRIVNQPYKWGWHEGELLIEVHPPFIQRPTRWARRSANSAPRTARPLSW
jgi:L,D-transpeptidase ErfK/SrfK